MMISILIFLILLDVVVVGSAKEVEVEATAEKDEEDELKFDDKVIGISKLLNFELVKFLRLLVLFELIKSE